MPTMTWARTSGLSRSTAANMSTKNDKRAFSIAEFCRLYGVGRTTAYFQINAKRLQVVKVGKRTLVPADAAESWIENLPTEQAEA